MKKYLTSINNCLFPLSILVIYIYSSQILFGVDLRGLDGPENIAPYVFSALFFPIIIFFLYFINALIVVPILTYVKNKNKLNILFSLILSVIFAFSTSLPITIILSNIKVDGIKGILLWFTFYFSIFLVLNILNTAAFYIQQIVENIKIKKIFIISKYSLFIIAIGTTIFFFYLFNNHLLKEIK